MIDYKKHWENVYSKAELNKLGWYEDNPQPSIELIAGLHLNKNSAILDVGSGVTTLIKNLIDNSYSNITAMDISGVALNRAKDQLTPEESKTVEWIADDITNPKNIPLERTIDLWHDRTVLHFLIEEKQWNGYLDTLKKVVKKNGYVIIAVFALEGASKCSGLEVKNYDHKMISAFLGEDFKLLRHFPHLYTMPSGDLRPYVYTLFQRMK